MNRKPASDTLQLTGDEKRRRSGLLRITWFDSVNSSQRPRLRHGASDEEQRLYFLWTQLGSLMQFDRQLSRRAVSESSTGAQLEKREILKFISPALENRLAKTELEYASATRPSVRSTRRQDGIHQHAAMATDSSSSSLTNVTESKNDVIGGLGRNETPNLSAEHLMFGRKLGQRNHPIFPCLPVRT